MTNLALAITYEVMFQRMIKNGTPVTRAWCIGCVPFLMQARDHILRRRLSHPTREEIET